MVCFKSYLSTAAAVFVNNVLLSVFLLSPLQLQSSVTEFEFSQEEYRRLQVDFWSKFYACCLQYQEVQSLPLGLTVSQNTGLVCLLKKVLHLINPVTLVF